MSRINIAHRPDHHVSATKRIAQHIRMERGSKKPLPQDLLYHTQFIDIIIEYFHGCPQGQRRTCGYGPSVLASIITTSVGDTPGIPPNKIPLPPWVLLNSSEAIVIEAAPSISEVTFSTGKRLLSSAINS